MGESKCSSGEQGAGAVFSATASKCRKVSIVGVDIIPQNVEKEIEEVRKPFKRKLPIAEKKVLDKEKDKNTRREIANKVLMKMVTECTDWKRIYPNREVWAATLITGKSSVRSWDYERNQ